MNDHRHHDEESSLYHKLPRWADTAVCCFCVGFVAVLVICLVRPDAAEWLYRQIP